MVKDKLWWFGENSLWAKFCRWVKKPQWILYRPTPPEPPEPEYVEVKICLKCGKLAVGKCPIGEVAWKRFLKGEEPTEDCTPSTCCNIPAPPKPPVLDEKKRWKPGRKLLSPILIPTLGINKKISDGDYKIFLDRFAENGWGNYIRYFVAGVWEPFTVGMVTYPYNKSGGKFKLDSINTQHFARLFKRGVEALERGIKPMIPLLDNCSLHFGKGFNGGWWSRHWMNGDNNINGTSNEAYSQTHWYEYDSPPDEREGMKETGKYLMELYDYVLEACETFFGNDFIIEIGNEIDARNIYHSMLSSFVRERLDGQPWLTQRIYTSMKHEHFYKASVQDSCIPILHGIQDMSGYEEKKHLVQGRHFGLSQDGQPPLTQYRATKENVLGLLKTPTKSYEGNHRPLFKLEGGKFVNLIRKNRINEINWRLTTLPFELFDAYGKAFEEYLG